MPTLLNACLILFHPRMTVCWEIVRDIGILLCLRYLRPTRLSHADKQLNRLRLWIAILVSRPGFEPGFCGHISNAYLPSLLLSVF